eukprot:scaffold63289_cov28-Tisochrysis_lutea.AAC.2
MKKKAASRRLASRPISAADWTPCCCPVDSLLVVGASPVPAVPLVGSSRFSSRTMARTCARACAASPSGRRAVLSSSPVRTGTWLLSSAEGSSPRSISSPGEPLATIAPFSMMCTAVARAPARWTWCEASTTAAP